MSKQTEVRNRIRRLRFDRGPHRAEIVADVQRARWLDAGEGSHVSRRSFAFSF